MKTRAITCSSTKKWLFTATLFVAVNALAAGDASSQQSKRNGVVLHEYFDPSLQIKPLPTAQPSQKYSEQNAAQDAQAQPTSANPPHVSGQPPALSLEINHQEPIFTNDGPLFDAQLKQPNGQLDPRDSTNQLDDLTDHVDPLQYFPQFDPSVLPYKRQVSQNQVTRTPDGSYRIELASKTFTPVDIPRTTPLTASSQEDTFWGSFLIRTESGQLHPIPSVAPDQRVLQLKSEPAVPLTIVRDQADNYYIRADYNGLVRVNLQLAAPRFYFDGTLQTTVRWNDFPPALRPTLAPEIRTVANRVLSKLAVDNRTMPPHDALMRLIEHFRDFESRALAANARTGDMYETIALGKAGVCRHRSHAFIISAHALGIPTRFIYNETHAFVEIYWPGQGWRRIDLGGAAENVEIHDNNNRALHDGTVNDPLPQPPAYISERERILGQSKDYTDSTAPTPALPTPPASAKASTQAETNQEQQPTRQPNVNAPATPQSAAEPAQEPIRDYRIATQLTITSTSEQILRGQAIALQGRLATQRGEPLDKQTIKIMLGPSGATAPQSATLLGLTQTDANGHFSTQFPISPNLSIGRWTLTAVFEGSNHYRPATSAP